MKSEGVFQDAGVLSFLPRFGEQGDSVPADSLVSARLYRIYPTQTQIEDSGYALGGALENVTSWSDGTETNEKRISYSPITDLNPDDPDGYDILYWVVSYKLDAAGGIINQVVPFVVWRAVGTIYTHGVTTSELFELETKLQDNFTITQLNSKIALAARLVYQELVGKGYDIKRVRLSDIKDFVRYKAVAICCGDLQNQAEDEWDKKYQRYVAMYSDLWQMVKIGFDQDDDGDIEADEGFKQNAVYILR